MYSADLLDSLTIYTLVMPNKQNNWGEVGYKNRFCNGWACKKKNKQTPLLK